MSGGAKVYNEFTENYKYMMHLSDWTESLCGGQVSQVVSSQREEEANCETAVQYFLVRNEQGRQLCD